MPGSKKKPNTVKFHNGDKVRVKYGVKDDDYPDMPLGGWAGKAQEVYVEDFTGAVVMFLERVTALARRVFLRRVK